MGFLKKVLPFFLFMIMAAGSIPVSAEADPAPVVSARSSVLMDQDSGRVIFEKNAHEKSRIASITKIMTALLAVESGKLDKMVKISDRAIGTEGSSLYLKKGEKMKLEDLVYGLMLRSGNDAAVAIAEEVGGSLEGFVWMMNQKAQEIGMEDSHFSNPHGLDNTPDHYSSAYDMALLTKYAMKNESYRRIAGSKSHRAPNSMESWDYVWKNKNRLLTGLYPYTTGGKTGYTKLAKRTLVSTASKEGMNLIAVTLNGPDDWNDHIGMYNAAFTGYKQTVLLKAGQIKGKKVRAWKNNLYIKKEFTYPLAKGEADQVEIRLALVKPSGKIPEIAGKASIYLDGKLVGSRSIYYGKPQETMSDGFAATWFDIFLSILGVRHG